MKKAFVLMTLLVLACFAVFAESGDTLQINANIKAVEPIFIIKGSFDTTSFDAVGDQEASSATNTLTAPSTVDISETPITVYVKVYQSNKAKSFANITLTVTASDLKNGSESTGNPSVGNTTSPFSSAADTDRLKVTPSPATGSSTSNVATFALDYRDGKPVNSSGSDMEVGATSFTWPKSENLAAGSYAATITLSYSAS